MATRKSTLSIWDVLFGAAILAALVVMIGLARNDRDASSSLITEGRPFVSRKPSRLENELEEKTKDLKQSSNDLEEKAEKVKQSASDLEKAEKKVKDAQSDLEKKSAEMAETKREIEKLSDESKSKATKTRQEIQESSDKLKIERDKLEQLGQETDAKARAVRQDIARLESLKEEQRTGAAQTGVLQGFGRAAPKPRPRPTMEQIVTYAQMQRPRMLSSREVNPVTGDITWPLLLADPIYSEYTRLLQDYFRQRADDGRVSTYEQITSVRDTINEFKSELKANFANYPAGDYGKARNFLESLQQNYQQDAT